MQSAFQSLHAITRWKQLETAFWLFALLSPWLLAKQALIINEIAIVALFALSLDLILGYTGIVSLGHAAFFGFGAYSAALFAIHMTPDPLLGLLFGAGVTLLLGALCSVLILRGSDLTRLMVTLAVALILKELSNKMSWLTGGTDGLQGVMMGPLLGKFDFDIRGITAAWYSLAITFLLFLLIRRIVHSPFGATLQAIRDNRLRAMAIGIPVSARIMVIYSISAAIAGASGALLAQTTSFASPDVFAFDRSADILLILVIGGTGWLYGGIIGAIVFKLLQDIIASITPEYWTFWIGVFLIALVMVGRDRFLHPWKWFKKS